MSTKYALIDKLCSLYKTGVIDFGLCRVYTIDDDSVTYWGSSIRQGDRDYLIDHDITPDIEKPCIRWIEIMPVQYNRIGRRFDFHEGTIDEVLLLKIASILVNAEIPFNRSYGNIRVYNPDVSSEYLSEEHLRHLSNIDVVDSKELLQNLIRWQSCRNDENTDGDQAAR
jgi:hypothetical protein